MTTIEDAQGRFDFGRVVSRTVGVMGRNLALLAMLVGVFYVAPALAVVALRVAMGIPLHTTDPTVMMSSANLVLSIGGGLLSVAGWSLMQIATLRATVSDLNGRKLGFGESLAGTSPLVLPMLGLAIVTSVGIGVGMLFLLIPGLILGTLWSVSGPALVAERLGVFASLQRSRDLTRHHRWPIFGLLLIYMIVYYAVSLALSRVVIGALRAADTGALTMTTLLMTAVGAVFLAVGAAGVAVIYVELRTAKEGLGPDQLGAVFD